MLSEVAFVASDADEALEKDFMFTLTGNAGSSYELLVPCNSGDCSIRQYEQSSEEQRS